MIFQKRNLVMLMTFLYLLIIPAVLLSKGGGRVMAIADADKGRRTVSAQGEGVVCVIPDTAYLTCGVETTSKDIRTAQISNKDKMNDIMTELSKSGIREQDIQTNNYAIYPNYQWENDKNILTGYKVVNTIRIKVKNLDEAGGILDAVAAKGANLIEGIQFTVEDAGKAYEEALKLAVKNAENKARIMTGCFGISKLVPVSITEKLQDYYPIAYENARMMTATDKSSPISSGQLEIRAVVDVSFEY